MGAVQITEQYKHRQLGHWIHDQS